MLDPEHHLPEYQKRHVDPYYHISATKYRITQFSCASHMPNACGHHTSIKTRQIVTVVIKWRFAALLVVTTSQMSYRSRVGIRETLSHGT